MSTRTPILWRPEVKHGDPLGPQPIFLHHWYMRPNENWTWVCADCGKVWRPVLTPPAEECIRVPAMNIAPLEEKSDG